MNNFFALLGSLVYGALYWALFAVVTRIGEPSDTGQFALGLAIVSPAMIAAQFGLRQYFVVDVEARYPFRDYALLRSCATAAAGMVVAAIACGYHHAAGVILALTAAKAVENGSDLVYGIHQKADRQGRIAFSITTKAALGMVVLIATFLAWRSLTVAVLALAGTWALVFVFVDCRTGAACLAAGLRKAEPSGHSTWSRRRELAQSSLPLAVATLLASLNTNLPRIIVEHIEGPKALASFVAATYLVVPGSMIMAALGQANVPTLARQYANGSVAQFRSGLLKLLAVGITFGALALTAAVIMPHALIEVLYGHKLAYAQPLVIPALIAATLTNVIAALSYGAMAAGRLRVQPLIQISGTAILMAIIIPAIRWAGQLGAVLSWCAALVFQACVLISVIASALTHCRLRPNTSEPEGCGNGRLAPEQVP